MICQPTLTWRSQKGKLRQLTFISAWEVHTNVTSDFEAQSFAQNSDMNHVPRSDSHPKSYFQNQISQNVLRTVTNSENLRCEKKCTNLRFWGKKKFELLSHHSSQLYISFFLSVPKPEPEPDSGFETTSPEWPNLGFFLTIGTINRRFEFDSFLNQLYRFVILKGAYTASTTPWTCVHYELCHKRLRKYDVLEMPW